MCARFCSDQIVFRYGIGFFEINGGAIGGIILLGCPNETRRFVDRLHGHSRLRETRRVS